MTNHIIINNKIKSFTKKIKVSSDKSISIRCVLLASQAIGQSQIYNLLESDDVINTLKSIKKLGINFKKVRNCYQIIGRGLSGYNTSRKIDAEFYLGGKQFNELADSSLNNIVN